jgi:ADP-ribosylglycohydrolase
MSETNEGRVSPERRKTAVINSALWAAAGDALGWISELTTEDGLKHRAGVRHLTSPIAWRRLIGGRGGVRIEFPAGTYSDDTQLRLGVCRAIRGNGAFDAEAFGKIELTVWQGYGLGGGRGTKAAAANLARKDVNWFSNFFEVRDLSYCKAGGNGAAMRIQPHVWAGDLSRPEISVLNVLRNAVITHGHPHGFVGAVFHAMVLGFALDRGIVPGPADWRQFATSLSEIGRLVASERQLGAFWQPAWESVYGSTLKVAIEATIDELFSDMASVELLEEGTGPDVYHRVLDTLGLYKPDMRGSGLKTALAAAVLSWMYRDQHPQEALKMAANALNSDTDTIATMVGAVSGATSAVTPDWPLQDRSYISAEASRLAKIAQGASSDGFAYPDLAVWQPPVGQSDTVVQFDSGVGLLGLGLADIVSDEYSSGEYIWQWMKLSFGQTVLAKRRRKLRSARGEFLPGERRSSRSGQPALITGESRQNRLLFEENKEQSETRVQRDLGIQTEMLITQIRESVDTATDEVIRSDFDDLTLGRVLNRWMDNGASIEQLVALTAIVAKAKLARRRRGR